MQEINAEKTPEALPKEVYGHLIPLQEYFLILPKMAVLEVLGIDVVSVQTAGPAWFLGMGDWRGKSLPVISIEALAGNTPPPRTRRTRVVVINGFGEHLDNGLFMLVSQGYPHLTALNSAALVSQARRPEDKDLALSRVRLASTQAIIPDLENIEMRIATALRETGGAAALEEMSQDWEPGMGTH